MCGCSESRADHLGNGPKRFALRSGLRGTRHDCFQSGRFCYVGTRQNVAYGSVYPDRPCSAAGRRRAGLLEIQNSTASTVESFYADNNGFGLLLEGSSNITVLGGTIANNTASGIELNEGSSNTLNGIVLDDNGTYGVWLDGSGANTVNNFTAEGNGLAGVYAGCSSSGPNGTTCASLSLPPSSHNTVTGGYLAPDESEVGNGWGIAIDTGKQGKQGKVQSRLRKQTPRRGR